ncbi:unnamed protein product, partial [Allacma fusca]
RHGGVVAACEVFRQKSALFQKFLTQRPKAVCAICSCSHSAIQQFISSSFYWYNVYVTSVSNKFRGEAWRLLELSVFSFLSR